MEDRSSILSDFPGLSFSPLTVVQILASILGNLLHLGYVSCLSFSEAEFLTGLTLCVTLHVDLLLSSTVLAYQWLLDQR